MSVDLNQLLITLDGYRDQLREQLTPSPGGSGIELPLRKLDLLARERARVEAELKKQPKSKGDA